MLIYGINPVLEALRARRVRELRVSGRSDQRLRELLSVAHEQGVHIRQVPVESLARDARNGVHQGVVAEVDESRKYAIADLLDSARDIPLIVVLDGIEDPHNLGAILRTADAAGVDGVIVQQRRSAALGGATAKASAGAIAHVKIAEVVNIARAIDELKDAGFWTTALTADGPTSYDTIDWTVPSAVVLGAEGSGIRALVRSRCDYSASIPMHGHVQSLNVSVAAGVLLYEAVRQRSLKAGKQ